MNNPNFLVTFAAILTLLTMTFMSVRHLKLPQVKRNLIFIIPEGLGNTPTAMLREHLNKKLNVAPFLQGSVRTKSANNAITDGAAAGTAFACGIKTNNGRVGKNTDGVPCENLLESARAKGYKVGIVTSMPLAHALPAAFSAHVSRRTQFHDIAAQQITKGIDLLLGGGLSHFKPKEMGGSRTDGRDLVKEAEEKHGYKFISTKKELRNQRTLPVLGIFTKSRFGWEIDRDETTPNPTLSELTEKAVELLKNSCQHSRSCPGYILIVNNYPEGSLQANDPGTLLGEAGEFDNTFGVASKLAIRFRDILLISTSTVDAGSLTLGTSKTGFNPTTWFPHILKKQIKSGVFFGNMLGSGMDIREAYSQNFGISDLTNAEVERAREIRRRPVNKVWGLMKPHADRSGIHYALHGDSGADVPLYALGPGSEAFVGSVDNTEIHKKIQNYLQL